MTGDLLTPARRTLRVVERNVRSSARLWPLFLSGLVEPLLYLLSIGFGVGAFVGPVAGPDGHDVPYVVFLAPAILAVSAMNTTVFNTTFVFFHKMRYAGTFHALLSTALDRRDLARGELVWTVLSSAVYAVVLTTAFAAMGLLPSAWSVLAGRVGGPPHAALPRHRARTYRGPRSAGRHRDRTPGVPGRHGLESLRLAYRRLGPILQP